MAHSEPLKQGLQQWPRFWSIPESPEWHKTEALSLEAPMADAGGTSGGDPGHPPAAPAAPAAWDRLQVGFEYPVYGDSATRCATCSSVWSPS